jgi:signal transduction histidine kinase
MLEKGEGAMISELIRTDARKEYFVWPENDTLTDNYVAISLDSMPNIGIHRIMQMKVGVQTGTAYAELFSTWFPDHSSVAYYDSTDDAFTGLENGEVDLLMFGMRNLLLATNYNENPGFKANIVFDYTFGSPFGFNKNEEILCSIINKAMDVIDTETISSQWMRRTYDYRAKLIQSQRPWLIGSIALALIVISLLFILHIRNRNIGKRLDKLVKQRTAEAVNANNAKSSFLATMSHEIRTPMNAIAGITQIQLQKSDLPADCTDAFNRIHNSSNNLLGIINDILDMSKIETGKLELNPIEYDVPNLIHDTIQLNVVRIGSKPIDFKL